LKRTTAFKIVITHLNNKDLIEIRWLREERNKETSLFEFEVVYVIGDQTIKSIIKVQDVNGKTNVSERIGG